MNLNFSQIKEITTGAARVEEEHGLVGLYRFTKEQEELYKTANADFHVKTFCTSGIKIQFKTDSKKLALDIVTERGSSRKYFSVDVLVDEKPVGYVDNFSGTDLPENYTTVELPLGEFSKEFELGDGVKTVCIHMPWSIKTMIKGIVIDENAFIEPVKWEKKLLAFGDSITHGYDALRPSRRYIARLSEKLGAEEFNKAIGGEKFFPELAKLKDSFVPDYITVAYGTNDWKHSDEATFKEKCRCFFENLRQSYPQSEIFAITPIWRKDMYETITGWDFAKIDTNIKDITKGIENVTVITGFDFVPQDENLYADQNLHPNDEGFEFYAENLYNKIKELKND